MPPDIALSGMTWALSFGCPRLRLEDCDIAAVRMISARTQMRGLGCDPRRVMRLPRCASHDPEDRKGDCMGRQTLLAPPSRAPLAALLALTNHSSDCFPRRATAPRGADKPRPVAMAMDSRRGRGHRRAAPCRRPPA